MLGPGTETTTLKFSSRTATCSHHWRVLTNGLRLLFLLEPRPYCPREAWNHSTNFGMPSAIFVCGS